MNWMEEPEEVCMNCCKVISGRFRRCEWCGKIWDVKNGEEEEDG